MNIEQAKAIPISEFLDKLNIKPVRAQGSRATYLSPIRQETTASFSVNTLKNCWFDHGLGIGGDIVGFVCNYLKYTGEDHTTADALRFIKNIAGDVSHITAANLPEEDPADPTLSITSIGPIDNNGLVDYLNSRGISLARAQLYLKQLKIFNKNTGKHFAALGFKNEDKGYEVRSAFFKGCVRHKGITHIRAKEPKNPGIHIFEGLFDFLSVLEDRNMDGLNEDAIVLNSVSMLNKAFADIKGFNFQIVYSWMDNDVAGKKATQLIEDFTKTEENLRHRPNNNIYRRYSDVNDWHMHKLGLKIGE